MNSWQVPLPQAFGMHWRGEIVSMDTCNALLALKDVGLLK